MCLALAAVGSRWACCAETKNSAEFENSTESKTALPGRNSARVFLFQKDRPGLAGVAGSFGECPVAPKKD